MLRIMCKRQHDNTYSKNLTGYKSTAQSKRERDDQALPGAFQNDRIKPSTFLFGFFVCFSHTTCHERTARPRSMFPPMLIGVPVGHRRPQVELGGSGSRRELHQAPLHTRELGQELHHSRGPLRANGMATGLHWSFWGRPALLHYLPVFALHWSARKVKSPAVALQVQDEQLGSPTARDGAPTQLPPWPQMLTWFWTTSLSGRKKEVTPRAIWYFTFYVVHTFCVAHVSWMEQGEFQLWGWRSWAAGLILHTKARTYSWETGIAFKWYPHRRTHWKNPKHAAQTLHNVCLPFLLCFVPLPVTAVMLL